MQRGNSFSETLSLCARGIVEYKRPWLMYLDGSSHSRKFNVLSMIKLAVQVAAFDAAAIIQLSCYIGTRSSTLEIAVHTRSSELGLGFFPTRGPVGAKRCNTYQ